MGTAAATVTFRIPAAFGGFADCDGVLQATNEGLNLEFQTKDGVFNVLKSDVRNIVVFWEDILRVEFKKTWFQFRLELVTRSIKTLEDVPGSKGCRVSLQISRQDREAAKELAGFANLRICERDLRQMQSDMRDARRKS